MRTALIVPVKWALPALPSTSMSPLSPALRARKPRFAATIGSLPAVQSTQVQGMNISGFCAISRLWSDYVYGLQLLHAGSSGPFRGLFRETDSFDVAFRHAKQD